MDNHHGHDHDGSAEPHVHLVSVGIDIGSSTSHLMFSQLAVGYPSAHRRRPEILERKVIARSPVLLTPFTGDWNIEAGPLASLIDESFRAAGLSRQQIDTGAVIITGEAARRENAQKIAELFSAQTGQFVCATAGPRLEALLAAHGSGAAGRSREEGTTLLNVDLGGGTTKLSVVEKGRITGVTAVNIGARLLAFDENRRLIRLEESGKRFLRHLGCAAELEDEIDEAILGHLSFRMASVLFDLIAGGAPPWPELLVMPSWPKIPALDGIVFSGGVSEYIYGRESAAFGDLGRMLGAAARDQAEKRGYRILASGEGIRATVIGASQYSMQISGETIFIPKPEMLPLRNLRVTPVRVEWESPIADRTESIVRSALGAIDPEVRGAPFAMTFASPPFLGYGAAQELAEGIRRALGPLPQSERPRLLVFEQNIGRVIGETLGPGLNIPCVDEISLGELDFIDVGTIVDGEGYVPVVVKSLAFGA
ncbi:MAG TPA: ethanolamine ammonia-lyase reactivating factor EutA [Candidatus Binatia bacterium]|jgi:ethanolamine utilization protein EutA